MTRKRSIKPPTKLYRVKLLGHTYHIWAHSKDEARRKARKGIPKRYRRYIPTSIKLLSRRR